MNDIHTLAYISAPTIKDMVVWNHFNENKCCRNLIWTENSRKMADFHLIFLQGSKKINLDQFGCLFSFS